jgi:hypothetical protein
MTTFSSSRWGISAAVVLAGVVAGLGLVYAFQWVEAYDLRSPSAPTTVPEIAEYTNAWRTIIKAKGGKNAYEQFDASVATLATSEQHSLAHLFAEALYDVEGVAGAAVCDSRFDSGCYHQMFGRQLKEQGITAARTLLAGCSDLDPVRASACRHGLGHAFLEFAGYDLSGVRTALAACDEDTLHLTMSRCYEGVFMEYNLHTMPDENAESFNSDSMYGITREFEDNWMNPCDVVGAKYRVSCISRLPEWWYYAALKGKSQIERYAALGEKCRELTQSDEELRACTLGVGKKAAIDSDENAERASSFCSAAFTGGDMRSLCHGHAAYFFTQSKGDPMLGAKTCDFLGESNEECLFYTTPEGPSWRVQWDA